MSAYFRGVSAYFARKLVSKFFETSFEKIWGHYGNRGVYNDTKINSQRIGKSLVFGLSPPNYAHRRSLAIFLLNSPQMRYRKFPQWGSFLPIASQKESQFANRASWGPQNRAILRGVGQSQPQPRRFVRFWCTQFLVGT